MPTIIRGDARALPLPDSSVDLVVTSPPYFGLRSYKDGGEHYEGQLGAEPTPHEYIEALIECTQEMVRVLKSSGSIFVNLGDKYSAGNSGQSGMAKLGDRYRGGGHADAKAKQRTGRVVGLPPKSLLLLPERYRIAAVEQLGLTARAVIVWAKTNGMPESVTDRVRRSHEDWVHLTKQPKYFATIDEIRRVYDGDRALSRRIKHPGEGKHQQRAPWSGEHPRGSLPGSVWDIATQPLKVPPELGVDHFAAFPLEWPRRLIKAWSPPGGVVLDPFGGTGTTALVATMLGRRGISVDLSGDYCRIAQWRATDTRERARAAGTTPTKARAVAPGQTTLFGGAA